MAGTKRSSSNRQPDFKRLRGKVGKRALKPANVTDTSFKSATLQVAAQAVDRTGEDDGTTILSSRGRSLAEITAQLNHPASAARISAIKGFGKIVCSASRQPCLLMPHLSIVVPACVKSIVDEDEDVRHVGLHALQDLISQQDESAVRPFFGLIVAYIASALNSLDADMRLHGARAVEVISKSVPNLVTPIEEAKILLPFANLIAEQACKAKHGEEILRALVGLLNTQEMRANDVQHDRGLENSDVISVGHGLANNAILLEGSRKPTLRLRHALGKIEDLPQLDELGQWNDRWNGLDEASQPHDSVAWVREGTCLPLSAAQELLSKLRDTLVETTEQGSTDAVVISPARTEPLNVAKLALVVEAMRLLWNQSLPNSSIAHPALSPRAELKGDLKSTLLKLSTQIASILLEKFPISQEDAKVTDSASLENLNGDICRALVDVAFLVGGCTPPSMGCSVSKVSEEDTTMLDCINSVCSYLLVHLEQLETIPSSSIDVIVQLLSRLEWTDNQKETLATGPVRILERIHSLFLLSDDSLEAARSEAGRKIALSMRHIMEQGLHQFDEDNEQPLGSAFVNVTGCLPSYLQAWGKDFLAETDAVVGLLLSVVRRINRNDHPLLCTLRERMSVVVAPSSTKIARKKSHLVAHEASSIFESYPPSLQRKVLGLLVMIESPSEQTLSGLAAICERCCLQAEGPVVLPGIADCIFECIHVIRKSLSMQSYLRFIVSGCGVHHASGRKKGVTVGVDAVKVDTEWIVSLDCGIQRACRAFVRSGASHKVLGMLLPVLTSWLKSESQQVSFASSPNGFSLRARAAIAVATVLIFNWKEGDPSVVSAFERVPQLKQPIIEAIAKMVAFSSTEDQENFKRWMGPMTAICQCEPAVFKGLLQDVAEAAGRDTLSDPLARGNTMKALIELSHETTIPVSLQGWRAELVEAARSIEACFPDEARAWQLSGRLSVQLEDKSVFV